MSDDRIVLVSVAGAPDAFLPVSTSRAGMPERQAWISSGLSRRGGCTAINGICGSSLMPVLLARDVLRAGAGAAMNDGNARGGFGALVSLLDTCDGHQYRRRWARSDSTASGLEGNYGDTIPMDAPVWRNDVADQPLFVSVGRTRRVAAGGQKCIGSPDSYVADGQLGRDEVGGDDRRANARAGEDAWLETSEDRNGRVATAKPGLSSERAPAFSLMRESDATKLGVEPRACVVGITRRARIPSEFSIAPVHAISSLLEQVGWKASDVDRWEINEAFAVVTLLAMREEGMARNQVNVHSCACAPPHWMGSGDEGALGALIKSLAETGGKRGIASLCIGGNEAVAIALERT